MMKDELSFEVNGLKIDPAIFTFKFGCKCNGQCCHYGVYTDLKEHELIMSLKDRLIPLMDETQTKNIEDWFEEPEKDEDFDSGVAVGTELYNKKCVFLDKDGLCIIQRLAIEEGANPWKYKPLYCILFPLTIFEGALTIDYEHMDRLSHCNKADKHTSTIYEYCRNELIHLFGEDGMVKLDGYAKEVLANVHHKEGN